jgi:hypothetical protein
MTPFQVYLLMQADSICAAAGALAVIGGIGFTVTAVWRYVVQSSMTKSEIDGQCGDWDMWQAIISLNRRCAWFFFPALFIAALMPNTKAIATMVVLPKITSPTALNALGAKGEKLYSIATDALQGLADRAKPAAPDDSKK